MLTWKSPAKTNLLLNLRRYRPDEGYHEICSVMQALSFYDELSVEATGAGEAIELDTNHEGLQADRFNNIVVTAYHRFWQATGLAPVKVRVRLEKHIFVEAGLGGGSSNAAAMLCLLNELTDAKLPAEQLKGIAATLGSDVPFFIEGGTALATGRGERIESLEAKLPAFEVVLIKPRAIGISTAVAYQQYRKHGRYHEVDPSRLIQALGNPGTTVEALEPLLYNDFERVILDMVPELNQLFLAMRRAGIGRPLLCGSGSTVMGLIPDSGVKEVLQTSFDPGVYDTVFCQTLPQAGQSRIRP